MLWCVTSFTWSDRSGLALTCAPLDDPVNAEQLDWGLVLLLLLVAADDPPKKCFLSEGSATNDKRKKTAGWQEKIEWEIRRPAPVPNESYAYGAKHPADRAGLQPRARQPRPLLRSSRERSSEDDVRPRRSPPCGDGVPAQPSRASASTACAIGGTSGASAAFSFTAVSNDWGLGFQVYVSRVVIVGFAGGGWGLR